MTKKEEENLFMKKWGKKYWKQGIIFFVVFIVAIPAVINWLFKQHTSIDFFVAEWEAGDVLGFYGTIVASIATILGVYLSIKYAQSNYQEDARNRIRPYFALTKLRTKIGFDSNSWKNNENVYGEYRLDRIYIVISEDTVTYTNTLDDRQRQLIATGGGISSVSSDGYILKECDYISIPFEAENAGNGTAVGFKLSFYSEKNTKKKHEAVSFYTLMQKDKIYFHIFSETMDTSVLGRYVLDLWYRDIEGTQYSQKYPVIFEKNKITGKLKIIFDFTGTQQIVKGEHHNEKNEDGNK